MPPTSRRSGRCTAIAKAAAARPARPLPRSSASQMGHGAGPGAGPRFTALRRMSNASSARNAARRWPIAPPVFRGKPISTQARSISQRSIVPPLMSISPKGSPGPISMTGCPATTALPRTDRPDGQRLHHSLSRHHPPVHVPRTGSGGMGLTPSRPPSNGPSNATPQVGVQATTPPPNDPQSEAPSRGSPRHPPIRPKDHHSPFRAMGLPPATRHHRARQKASHAPRSAIRARPSLPPRNIPRLHRRCPLLASR